MAYIHFTLTNDRSTISFSIGQKSALETAPLEALSSLVYARRTPREIRSSVVPQNHQGISVRKLTMHNGFHQPHPHPSELISLLQTDLENSIQSRPFLFYHFRLMPTFYSREQGSHSTSSTVIASKEAPVRRVHVQSAPAKFRSAAAAAAVSVCRGRNELWSSPLPLNNFAIQTWKTVRRRLFHSPTNLLPIAPSR
ncbi:uncharacterized protein CLUP02_11875 [Colletotrichum lupini]|uniref:Uncharacterized protein n=1 Tax=Colletotrichum lupini TaxID=145971 RepID=A0A9Q8WKV5_9PEZI|nr:uncharacterized protein CLUP02_11875 [Colletotrichum lupini]UQC86375.1 hypothetical protein CLUP02_11875 [Colletotrichum lupini]